jgi:hypothetical protein
MVAVALDNAVKSLCPDKGRMKPHTPLFVGGECAVLEMNLDHERKIVELQSRVNKLENLCYMTKEFIDSLGL